MSNAIENLRDEMVLLIGDHYGQYIPKQFAEDFTDGNICDADGVKIGDSEEHKFILECLEDISNPENRYYWDAWETITNTVHVYKEVNNGQDIKIYSLYQNGDLYAIPVEELEALTEEESEEFWNEMVF